MLSSTEQLRNNTNYGQCHLHKKIEENKNYEFNQVIQVQNMRFTPYTIDEVNDAGWGCAWRSIQMLLSSYYEKTPEFKWLFSFFGQKAVLQQIYMHMKQLDNIPWYLNERQFAPHEFPNGWAEPFIGQLVLHYMGFKSKLILVNGYPNSANAPEQVFDEIQTFQQFKSFLNDHFSNTGPKSPIQIDDATYSMVIYSVKFKDDLTILYIGDPHIYSNKSKELNQIGLYEITLNSQGDQIDCSIKKEEEQYYMYLNSFKTLHFNGKKWMVVAVTDILDVWYDWKDRQLIVELSQ